jgi:predicted transcriptional regulator
MPKEAVFTMKLETELREAFMAEAEAARRPASQIVREMMADYVDARRAEREHDEWFHAEVEEALREADDPSTQFFSHEEVMAEVRARLEKRIAEAESRAPQVE